MLKKFFVNLQRQIKSAAESRCPRVAFFLPSLLELIYRIVWGTGNSPEGSALLTLTARNAVFVLCQIQNLKS